MARGSRFEGLGFQDFGFSVWGVMAQGLPKHPKYVR